MPGNPGSRFGSGRYFDGDTRWVTHEARAGFPEADADCD
jgi:hypothetical protein